MAYQLPQDVRKILIELAAAILPLDDWTKGKEAPKLAELIEPLQDVPWRKPDGSSILSTEAVETIAYFEAQFDGESYSHLAARWNELRGKPLKHFQPPSGTPVQWRIARGLNVHAKFGAIESGNFPFVTGDANGNRLAASRPDFYDACWEPLKAAYVEAGMPVDRPKWIAFADQLLAGSNKKWPPAPVSSSEFVRRFMIDVLIACFGQGNGKLPDVWRRAGLIEAFENRHVGNDYTTAQASNAVERLKQALP
jgi:hypothetical protein